VESPDTPDKPARPPKRVFAVIFPLVFIAFVLGVQLSAKLTHELAPCAIFGIHATQAQHITILADHRGSVRFSNGETVRGLRLLPLDVIFCVLVTVILLGSFFALLRVAAFIIRRLDPDWAEEVLHFLKHVEETSR